MTPGFIKTYFLIRFSFDKILFLNVTIQCSSKNNIYNIDPQRFISLLQPWILNNRHKISMKGHLWKTVSYYIQHFLVTVNQLLSPFYPHLQYSGRSISSNYTIHVFPQLLIALYGKLFNMNQIFHVMITWN